MFNLQSGLHRQRFPARLTPAQARKLKLQQLATTNEHSQGSSESDLRRFSPGEGKHTKAVTGLIVDGLNRTVISCGLDCRVKVSAKLNWHELQLT